MVPSTTIYLPLCLLHKVQRCVCVCECARGWLRFPLHMCACVSCRINDTARFVSSDFAKMEREEVEDGGEKECKQFDQ